MISRIFFACVGILFAIYIIRTTTRNKILERESLIWLLSVIAIVGLGIFPQVLDWAAFRLNIAYGPSLLFLLSNLVLAMLLLRQTMESARHLHRIEELGHRIALLEEEVHREMNKNVNDDRVDISSTNMHNNIQKHL